MLNVHTLVTKVWQRNIGLYSDCYCDFFTELGGKVCKPDRVFVCTMYGHKYACIVTYMCVLYVYLHVLMYVCIYAYYMNVCMFV